MRPNDLLETADVLFAAKARKPRQADLRRAVSTVYYALFHTLARCCADAVVGKLVTGSSEITRIAWHQAYRGLNHATAKEACNKKKNLGKLDAAVQNFAATFVWMQEERHNADYNPETEFYKSQVKLYIEYVRYVIDKFERAPSKDRRAFSALILFKNRS